MSKAYVYITTNLINGKKYVGKHNGDKLDPSYYGSGTIIVRALEKYGPENFSVEVVEFFDTEEEAYFFEHELIQSLGADISDDYYNISCGGDGFIDGGAKYKIGRKWVHKSEGEKSINRLVSPEEAQLLVEQKGFTYGHSLITVRRTTITNGIEERQVPVDEAPEWYAKGWWHGRKSKNASTAGYIIISKDGRHRRIPPEQFDELHAQGWERDCMSHVSSTTGKVAIHRGRELRFVDPEEATELVDTGEWELGGLTGNTNNRGKKRIYRIREDGSVERTLVYPEELDDKLKEGWLIGSGTDSKGIPHRPPKRITITDGTDIKKVPRSVFSRCYRPKGWKEITEETE